MKNKKGNVGSIIRNGNKLIWSPKESYPDTSRQIPKYIKHLSNTKVPTMPTTLYYYVGVKKEYRGNVVHKDFWININKVKEHMKNVSEYVRASVFAGKTYDKVFDSVLFEKYKGEEKIFGDITIGLRSNDENRNERSLFFGVSSNIKGTLHSEKEKDFESFVFMGIFGGGKENDELGNSISLTFTDVIIDFNSKEIYHEIDFKKLSIFLKETSGFNDLNIQLTLESSKGEKIKRYKSFKWDFNPSEKEKFEKYNQTITINRDANLSLKHNEINDRLTKYLFDEKYLVKQEAYGHIDLLAENKDETIIFEIKTARSELFKAIGQIQYYKKLVLKSGNHNKNIKTIILFDEQYKFDDDFNELLNELNIEIKTINDYIK